MSSDTATPNRFTHGPLGAIFAKTALPIIFMMSLNGLLTVVDAVFLGSFVGPAALTAVTLTFPVYILITALATLVGSGMSSLLARRLGAGAVSGAHAVFAGAHGLALTISLGLILLFAFGGWQVTLLAANGVVPIAEMGHVYLAIIVFASPVMFMLTLHADALRNEGLIGVMAVMSIVVSTANIAFNYILIVWAGLGVAGSAYGTVLAQTLALTIIVGLRLKGKTVLRLSGLGHHAPTAYWRRIFALGAPQSLSFIGLALVSGTILTMLQLIGNPGYDDTVAAYGIVTRIMTFTFLPLLGLSMAMQSIIGNNYGAGLWQRSNTSLRLALLVAFLYCAIVQAVLILFPQAIASLFVKDGAVIGEVGRIMPVMVVVYCVAGPLMMIAGYFQAIGDAGRAAILSLAKYYVFMIPLMVVMPRFVGEAGIWWAGPGSELLLLALTFMVLGHAAHRRQLRWGLFAKTA